MNLFIGPGGPCPVEGAGEGGECRDQGDFRQVAFVSLFSLSMISFVREKIFWFLKGIILVFYHRKNVSADPMEDKLALFRQQVS